MNILNGYVLALVALLAYLFMVAVGRRTGIWKRVDVTFYGPVMMLKTRRGQAAINKLASRNKLWAAYGTCSIVVTIAATVALTVLLVWEVYATASGATVPRVDERIAPAPSGSNLSLILIYFVIGLGIAVLAHEFVHGVLSVVGKIKIESMGLLLLLVPVGAFVEPNDSELKSAAAKVRLRLYASGPATNIIVAVLLMTLLIGILSPAASPIAQGAVVTEVVPGSPADVSGIRPWSEITAVGGSAVSSSEEFSSLDFNYPGELTSVNLTFEGRQLMMAIPGGIVVTSVTEGPALNAGIKPGMIIGSLNDTIIHSSPELTSVIENATNERPVNVTVLEFGQDTTAGVSWFVKDEKIGAVNLTSKWLYYYTHYPSMNKEAYKNVSFMGASFSPLGVVVQDPEELVRAIAHPFAGAKGADDVAGAVLNYLALPLNGYSPMVPPASDLFGPSGALAFLPHDVYWTMLNFLYWTFWANLMLGLANALPALPMDGGLVLRDALKGLAKKAGERLTELDRAIGRRPFAERNIDRIIIGMTIAVFVMVLYLLLWQVYGFT